MRIYPPLYFPIYIYTSLANACMFQHCYFHYHLRHFHRQNHLFCIELSLIVETLDLANVNG